MKHKTEIYELLDKAKRSREAAKELLNNGHPDFAVSRTYYTMFYCAEALLLSKELAFSKHSAVISFFGKEFIKSGSLPERLHLYIRNAFDLRAKADYDTIPVDEKEAKELLNNSQEFIKLSEDFLRNLPSE